MTVRTWDATSLTALRQHAGATARTMLFERAGPGAAGSVETGRRDTLLFEQPEAWIAVRELPELREVFAEIERWRQKGFWVAGYLSYECGYHWQPKAYAAFQPKGPLPLAVFGVYRQPLQRVYGDGTEDATCGLLAVRPRISAEAYREQFDAAQRWISAGHTYQVNLTLEVEAAYRESAAALFAHMGRRQPSAFGAMLHLDEAMVLSASPELFFDLRDRAITTRPMKGTAARGRDAGEDDALATALALDEKNRAENVMIVDLLRNDLGRIAEVGSVRTDKLFAVERLPSLLQMTSEVTATLRQDVGMYELFRALFPSGSIVGAPKLRTMQILRELEGRDRGVYTGAIGYMAPEGEAVFSVAIRTATLQDGRVVMGIGSGVTSGSVADAEYDECLLKAQFLLQPPFHLIESLRWEHGGCALLEYHLDRMEGSAAHFGFAFARESLAVRVAEACRALPEDAWKVRLLLDGAGQVTVQPVRLAEEAPRVLRAMLWPEPVRSGDLWLRHKTTNRALYDEAQRTAEDSGCVDALFRNEQGHVTEGAIHSVFVKHGERWRTPPLGAGILPGVYRRHLLETRPEIEEADVTVEELLCADEIWLTNAVRGVRRVTMGQADPRG